MLTKCQPPRGPYHKDEFNVCTEPNTFDALFLENINDVAKTLVKIMIICGIKPCNAKAAKSIIIKIFKIYDIKRHRFNVIDEEITICRNNLICNLKFECLMTSLEALLAYSIIKRAVKAFYHGTPDYSIRSPITEAVILKEQEFIWQHAATRTIQIFESYENVFYFADRNCAKKIVKAYKQLYERLKNRANPVIIEDYQPRGCVRKFIIGTKSPPKLNSEKKVCVEKCSKIENMKDIINKFPNKKIPLTNERQLSEKITKSKSHKNIDLHLPRCYQCNCPQLICDCAVEKDTGLLAIDCSQGPYECQWYRIDKIDKPDLCIEKRELHQCPVDCLTSDSSSELDECEYCECSDEDENNDQEVTEEEEGDVFEKSDNEESLNKIMAKNLPNHKNNDYCQIREISKLPAMKIDQ